MKFPPVSDIKRMRKALDVTQAQLAALSGVSQSTIAKVERESISAGYSTIVRLFEALDALYCRDDRGLTAADVASKGVVAIESSCTVREASDLMKSTGYSQIPVVDAGTPVGSISERSIFGLLRMGRTMEELAMKPIYKVMDDSYPVVSDGTPISVITAMMAANNAILVARKGRITGLITSADMLKLI